MAIIYFFLAAANFMDACIGPFGWLSIVNFIVGVLLSYWCVKFFIGDYDE